MRRRPGMKNQTAYPAAAHEAQQGHGCDSQEALKELESPQGKPVPEGGFRSGCLFSWFGCGHGCSFGWMSQCAGMLVPLHDGGDVERFAGVGIPCLVVSLHSREVDGVVRG